MPRKAEPVEEEFQFVEELPSPRGEHVGRWARVLEPLIRHPGRVARVAVKDDAEMANTCAKNLRYRRVQIPRSDDPWEFYARGCEVFAIYKAGKKQLAKGRTGSHASQKRSVR